MRPSRTGLAVAGRGGVHLVALGKGLRRLGGRFQGQNARPAGRHHAQGQDLQRRLPAVRQRILQSGLQPAAKFVLGDLFDGAEGPGDGGCPRGGLAFGGYGLRRELERRCPA